MEPPTCSLFQRSHPCPPPPAPQLTALTSLSGICLVEDAYQRIVLRRPPRSLRRLLLYERDARGRMWPCGVERWGELTDAAPLLEELAVHTLDSAYPVLPRLRDLHLAAQLPLMPAQLPPDLSVHFPNLEVATFGDDYQEMPPLTSLINCSRLEDLTLATGGRCLASPDHTLDHISKLTRLTTLELVGGVRQLRWQPAAAGGGGRWRRCQRPFAELEAAARAPRLRLLVLRRLHTDRASGVRFAGWPARRLPLQARLWAAAAAAGNEQLELAVESCKQAHPCSLPLEEWYQKEWPLSN